MPNYVQVLYIFSRHNDNFSTTKLSREQFGVGGAFSSAYERSERGKLLCTSLNVDEQSGKRLKVVDEGLETRRREFDEHIAETLL